MSWNLPSTQTCPWGILTSRSGYGGRVLMVSPATATILLIKIRLGLSGELLQFRQIKNWTGCGTQNEPKGYYITSSIVPQGVHSKSTKDSYIS